MPAVSQDEIRQRWRDAYRRRVAKRLASGLTTRGLPRQPRPTEEEIVSNRRARCRRCQQKAESKAKRNAWMKEYMSRPGVADRIKKRNRLYLEKNRVQIYAARKINEERNPTVRLKHNLRCRLREAIRAVQGKRRGSVSAVRDLGCSIPFFMEYIASQFQDGMSWDNWGQWHLDHIRPLCDFDLKVRDEALKACHYTNLQPLWAADNLSKNRYTAKDMGGA